MITAPYSRVQLFSGGGARFGYYLGSYAALCEHNLKPDLIIASCGGSLAALLVDIAPEPKQLQALSISQELFEVMRAFQPRLPIQANNHTRLSKPRYFPQALKRWLLTKQNQKLSHCHLNDSHDSLLAELHNFAMFEVGDEATWLASLMSLKYTLQDSADLTAPNTTTDIAVIASRLLSPHASTKSALLQELLFAPANVVAHSKRLIENMSENVSNNDSENTLESAFSCPTHAYASQRIAKPVQVVEEWSMVQAVRASMADMYYLQPLQIDSLGWCLGGVINLTPIELASQLGKIVFAETKAPYDKHLALPAIKRIFGFDPNQRLNAVHDFKPTHSYNRQKTFQNNSQIHWLPFADNGQALAGQHVRKRINFRAGLIEPIHPDYDGFVKQMQAQWQYGYERTCDALKNSR